VAQSLGWRPLALARAAVGRLRRLRTDDGGRPQTFDETAFFRNMGLWRRLAPAVNLYWYGVLRLMSARGPGFEVDRDFRTAPFTHCQVLVTGRRGAQK
jgi:hypothetical protein